MGLRGMTAIGEQGFPPMPTSSLRQADFEKNPMG
jgi:hypothetical protein